MAIKIPNLGEGVDAATVLAILVSVGDTVSADQTLLELETAKAVAPLPSPEAGVVESILIKEGDKVSIGQPVIQLKGQAVVQQSGTPAQTQVSQQQVSAAPVTTAPIQATSTVVSAPQQYTYQSLSGSPPPASPTVRKVAAQLGIDLLRVKGNESGGRIGMEDLKTYIQQLQAFFFNQPESQSEKSLPKPTPSIDFSKWGPVTPKKLSSLRKTIGDNMVSAWTTIPHVTQFDQADITPALALRKQLMKAYEQKGARLTLTGFVLKAVIEALKKYPLFNTSYDEGTESLIYKDYIHLGVAVDTEAGLMVPVIKNADKKSVLELSLEIASLAKKARNRKIALDDLKGGSFTVSNLGGLGGTHFTPIVNKPEVAILGVGRGILQPVWINNQWEPRTFMPLAVSYDHRVIDGADGARFIKEIANQLENMTADALSF